MKRPTLFLRIAAGAVSLLLAAAYVYDRAGGNILPRFGSASPSKQAPSEEMLGGTKSKLVFEAGEQPQAASSEQTILFPGSKSAVIIDIAPDGASSSPSEPVEEPQAAEPVDHSPQRLLPGPKSDAIFSPQQAPAK